MPNKHTKIVEGFFLAMQAGASSEHEMMALFAEDAVYVEPFSGTVREHRGRPAVHAAMRDGWRTPLPEMRIEVDTIAVDGDTVRAQWTCYSPAIPGGKGRGENVFTLRDGLIVRLETRFLNE
jgi:ketosteroid isomerase-like protein